MPKPLESLTLTLVIVGALNWLLVALFEFDLVATIVGLDFGETNAISRIIYALVGVSGLVQIGSLVRGFARE